MLFVSRAPLTKGEYRTIVEISVTGEVSPECCISAESGVSDGEVGIRSTFSGCLFSTPVIVWRTTISAGQTRQITVVGGVTDSDLTIVYW